MSYFKILSAISLSFFLTTSYSQQESHDYFFREIGWTITLPYDFTLLDLNNYAMNIQGQTPDVEDASEMSADMMETQTMCIAIKDRFNHFNITITPFDTEVDGSWEKTNQSAKDQAYRTMTKIMGNEKLDTSTSIEYIDGLSFQKFQISATINGEEKVDMFLLSKWYKGYDFSMVALSINDETKKQIELMLRSSRFN